MYPLVLAVFLALVSGGAPPSVPFSPEQFGRYWYQGKAELTRYELKQARYGEIHSGEAMLIFVTEPFLPDRQVKLERGDPSKGVTVLKLNSVRKFFTGIYPYSLMTSTFTPVSLAAKGNRTLKVASSSQEWCGQTFTQLNLRGSRYEGALRSYFEDEGDRAFGFEAAWLEDELWTRIRLAPETLPVGQVEVVPGLQYARLWHKDVRPEKADATLRSDGRENVSWEETQPGGFDGSPLLTTKAVATRSLMLDYWKRHDNADAHFRKELGLTMW
jgi:hypothetical protein